MALPCGNCKSPNCPLCRKWDDPGPTGEAFRKAWGAPVALPGLVRQAGNRLRADARHLADGLAKVSEATYQLRLATCATCDRYRGGRCLHAQCGCPIASKARRRSERCPLGLWEQAEAAQEPAA